LLVESWKIEPVNGRGRGHQIHRVGSQPRLLGRSHAILDAGVAPRMAELAGAQIRCNHASEVLCQSDGCLAVSRRRVPSGMMVRHGGSEPLEEIGWIQRS